MIFYLEIETRSMFILLF